MKICFTGDLFVGGDLQEKTLSNIVDIDLYNNSEFRISNLEHPISDNSFIENKSTLFANSESIRTILDIRLNAVCLANNHIHDKGDSGILSTLSHLKNNNIGSFGAGTSIFDAEKPYFICSDLAVLGYCDFEKKHLNQVKVATKNSPGVNPLRLEKILSDLESLKNNQEAVIYLHWGEEHVYFPPYEDIKLVKKLLEHKKVALVIGAHAHIVQGIISHNGKYAYMCLGNFLFPNFYISNPTQINYPTKNTTTKYSTRLYHQVYKLTYKKWKWINRLSLILQYDTVSKKIIHKVVLQKDNEPKIIEPKLIQKFYITFIVKFLSLMYKLPFFLYKIFQISNSFLSRIYHNIYVSFFYINQRGFKNFIKKFFEIIFLNIKKFNR